MSGNGTDRRRFLKTFGGLGAGLALTRSEPGRTRKTTVSQTHEDEPLDTVRLALIGVGARGRGHLRTLLLLDGVEVRAIADTFEPNAEECSALCTAGGAPSPDLYTDGEYAYRRILDREDIDAVIISTPWSWHARMAIDTLQALKHAFVEVPAALTVEECWELVDTTESTGRYCMMLENVCYGREELMVLNMCRQGLFGELTHGEAAYIHDLREQMHDVERGTGSWRTGHHVRRNANLYPTHGLGPIAQYMNVNRGDRFEYLTSMSSPALGRQLYAREHFPADHVRNRDRYICGDMNSTLIRTAKGRTILVQHDTTTPRPYSRLNLIQGTRGAFSGYPNRIVVEGRGDTHRWQQIDSYRSEFEHPLWTRVGAEAERAGGHGGMDFVMLWRAVYCLRNGLELDQDVYDAASWSVVAPLSEKSVASRSDSVDVPDFTRGAWERRPPLEIVS